MSVRETRGETGEMEGRAGVVRRGRGTIQGSRKARRGAMGGGKEGRQERTGQTVLLAPDAGGTRAEEDYLAPLCSL